MARVSRFDPMLRSAGGGCGSWFDALNLGCLFRHYAADFVSALQVEPELLCGSEKAGRTNGRVGADSSALKNDVVDPRRRNVQPPGQRVSGHAEGLKKLLPQDFARVDSPVRCALS